MQALIYLRLNQTYQATDHSLLTKTEGPNKLNKQTHKYTEGSNWGQQG